MYDGRDLTVEQIGKILGVSRTSIYRALAVDPVAEAAATGELEPKGRTGGGVKAMVASTRRSRRPALGVGGVP